MRVFIAIFLLFSFLLSKTVVGEYKVGYGIFDEIGKAKAIYSNKDNSFHIKIEAKADGFLSAFSNRVESYESFGRVENGLLIPTKFTNYKQSGSDVVEKIYHFDHQKKIVTKTQNDKKNSKILKTKKSKLKFYAKDDILTLFFNLKHLNINQDNFKLYAVGGNKKDGHIDIIRPKSQRQKELNNLFEDKKGDFLIAILYRKIFLSNKGELIIKLDEDFLCKEAILKDILLYGDIKGKLIKKDLF